MPTGAGYLQGGLNRENWERAITAIVQTCMKQCTHPGINFLIKHVGYILRQLFYIALEDMKSGEEFSSTFQLIPPAIERHLLRRFDEMLWDVMKNAGDKSHVALEPMYSTMDPNLPTFHTTNMKDDDPDTFVRDSAGSYVQTPRKNTVAQMANKLKERVTWMTSFDGAKAKDMLKDENRKRATEKKAFLPDERTAMITNDETHVVIETAFKYMIALMEFNNVVLRFMMNHYLYEGFKKRLNSFTREMLIDDEWSSLLEPDTDLAEEKTDLEDKITSLKDSLQEVLRMQARL